MVNGIGQDFIFYNTAMKFGTKETYFDKENTAKLFEIKSTLHDMKQGEMFVTHFINLTRNWKHLDSFENQNRWCFEDARRYWEIVEKEKIINFLISLNKSLDEVNVRIPGTKPLPTLKSFHWGLKGIKHKKAYDADHYLCCHTNRFYSSALGWKRVEI